MAAAKPEAIALKHSVVVSPIRRRTRWAIKLVVGTLNLKKGRKLQYSVHFRSFTYFCVVAFTSLPYCFFIRVILEFYCDICTVSLKCFFLLTAL